MNSHIAYISVGSNLGNRSLNCLRGISAIEASDQCQLLLKSVFYETEPVDYRDQRWFVNAVIKIETFFDPFVLLTKLKAIESESGRNFKEVRFGPRILDLDIIFYDNRLLDTDNLVIPHPRMHLRRFVLQPLCDIAPKMIHPVLKRTMVELLETQQSDHQRIFKLSCEY